MTQDLDLYEMASSLYRLRIPGERAHLLNCYLWLGPDGVTLVDTGWPDSTGLVDRALKSLGKGCSDVTRIILTHFHEDHTGSAAEIALLSGAEVVAGSADVAFVKGDVDGPLPRLTTAERSIHPDSDVPPHGPPCRVDTRVADGDVLDFAGGAQVVAVPGHTPGSIALYLPEPDTLLTGDAVAEFNGNVILGVFNVDRLAATRSLAKLAATGAGKAGFGHGEVVEIDAHERIRTAVDPFA